jgi:hypothetical protein
LRQGQIRAHLPKEAWQFAGFGVPMLEILQLIQQRLQIPPPGLMLLLEIRFFHVEEKGGKEGVRIPESIGRFPGAD